MYLNQTSRTAHQARPPHLSNPSQILRHSHTKNKREPVEPENSTTYPAKNRRSDTKNYILTSTTESTKNTNRKRSLKSRICKTVRLLTTLLMKILQRGQRRGGYTPIWLWSIYHTRHRHHRSSIH